MLKLRKFRKLEEWNLEYNTKQREILLKFFNKHHDSTFSAYDLAGNLKHYGISLSAIYRNLSELEKAGKVKKVTKNGSRKAYFQFVDCDDCKGHLHLSCIRCGKTSHLDDKNSSLIVKNVLNNANFNVDKASTVIYGVCADCNK